MSHSWGGELLPATQELQKGDVDTNKTGISTKRVILI